MKSQTYPETIPAAFAKCEHLSSAYRRGWNNGHGIACHNVPEIGAKVFSDALGRVAVDADNIRGVHESACFEAEMGSRDFSPWEFVARELNDYDDGGFFVINSDGEEVGVFDNKEDARAHAEKHAEDNEDLEGFTIEERPSADEVWQAYDQGVADAVHADLATYSDADYGIEAETVAEKP